MLKSVFVLFSCLVLAKGYQARCQLNEELRCVNSCPPEKTCKNRDIQFSCLAIYEPCRFKCVCKQGYLRNSLGICVPKAQCCNEARCQLNEELRCVNSCPPEKTCKNRDIPFFCAAIYEPCRFKCVCKQGYFRNSLGTCITKAQCDLCPGKNEFFACDSACDNECSTLHKQNRTNCPIQNIICNRRCYCENGYARDQKGHCIPIEKCPPANCKNLGPNEE